MKKILSGIAVVVFVLAFNVLYADEMPGTRPFDSGAYYGRTLTEHEMVIKGEAPGGIREEKGVEHGYSIIDTLSPAEFNKGWGVKGSAAGGIRSEGMVHEFSIIDILSPTGVSRDLP